MNNYASNVLQFMTEDVKELREAVNLSVADGGVLARVSGLLSEEQVSEKRSISRFKPTMEKTCNDLQDAIAGLINNEAATGEEDRRRLAFQAISDLGVLASESDVLDGLMTLLSVTNNPISNAAKGIINTALGWLSNHIKPLIKKISSQLWSLISHMITPKSWTVQGQTGVSLFGLTGNVSIGITF